MKKIITAVALGALLLTCDAGCNKPISSNTVEQEDCDAEDYANREDDCGFTDADRRKTKKPAPTTTRRR